MAEATTGNDVLINKMLPVALSQKNLLPSVTVE